MTLVSNPNGRLQGILQVFIIMTNEKLTDPFPFLSASPTPYQGREDATASASRCHIHAQLEGKAVILCHPACLVISRPLLHREELSV